MNDDLVAVLERERLNNPRREQTRTPQKVLDMTAQADRMLMLADIPTADQRRRHLRRVA